MEAAIEYRLCEKRSNRPRVKQEICQACPEDCEFAGAKPESGRWLKDCEICNVGLCSYIDELTEKKGLSVNAAAKKMAEEADGLYSKEVIRQRYNYYKNPNYKSCRNSTTPQKTQSSPPTPKVSAPKNKQELETEPRLEENFKPLPDQKPQEIIESDDLQSLKFFWLRASDEDRENFLYWIKEVSENL